MPMAIRPALNFAAVLWVVLVLVLAAATALLVGAPRDFWAVFDGCYALLSSPTWRNAGVLWCFVLVRPVKPPRGRRRGRSH